jgi:hypothetical protein
VAVHLSTAIDIEASPDAVWSVLADLAAYAQWNPFIRSASGTLAEGERIDVEIRPPQGRGMRLRPTLRVVDPGRELRWLGHLGVPGIFDGEHGFTIEATPGGSRLTHEEHFSGALVPLFARGLRKRYLPAFESMNDALKARTEGTGAAAV